MIQAVLTDIEGTTTSVAFVYDVLFPYARATLPDFIRRYQHHPGVASELETIRTLTGQHLDLEAIIELLIDWMDADLKRTPLKTLQGMVWETGYHNGDFLGHIYADAFRQLTAWKTQGLRLFVYSSGSIQAQRLLFGHTEFGDLTGLFDNFFDTTSGPKRSSESYLHIADVAQLAPEFWLFLSDIPEELAAARSAGMQVYWLVRDSQPSDSLQNEYSIAHHFEEIILPL